jgi:hypothetical protein
VCGNKRYRQTLFLSLDVINVFYWLQSPDTDRYYEDMDEQLQQGMQQDMVDPMSIDPQVARHYQ